MKIYGSKLCPHCRALTETLEAAGIAFELLDITEDLRQLKAFLRLRDTLPLFEPCKAEGRIGIPLLVLEDGTLRHDWQQWCAAQGITPLLP